MGHYKSLFACVDRTFGNHFIAPARPEKLPIEGEPADVVAIVEKNAEWLTASRSLPKLFINGDPGASISGRLREFCRTLPNQREITVKGLHHLQEDSPNEIVAAIRDFVVGA